MPRPMFNGLRSRNLVWRPCRRSSAILMYAEAEALCCLVRPEHANGIIRAANNADVIPLMLFARVIGPVNVLYGASL